MENTDLPAAGAQLIRSRGGSGSGGGGDASGAQVGLRGGAAALDWITATCTGRCASREGGAFKPPAPRRGLAGAALLSAACGEARSVGSGVDDSINGGPSFIDGRDRLWQPQHAQQAGPEGDLDHMSRALAAAGPAPERRRHTNMLSRGRGAKATHMHGALT